MSNAPSTRDARRFLTRMKEARIGDPNAQYDVALMYANGLGVAKDVDQALLWTQSAAEKGNLSAQYLLGRAYQQGLGTEQNPQKALLWFQKAAERGSDKAALKLATLYAQPQKAIAFQFALDAAERGNSEAQLAVGNFLAQGCGVSRDESQACVWYARAAEQGLATAQYMLGLAQEQGAGTKRDLALARKWYRDAAAQGLPAAQLALDRMDETGTGRGAEKAKAGKKAGQRERRSADTRWIQFAAKGGAEDFYHLGQMFEAGVGVVSSVKQARLWFHKAAELGHVESMVSLAQLLRTSDPRTAADLYIRAAELGHADAQCAVAETLAQGKVGIRDFQGSLYWYVLSAQHGHAQAQGALATLLHKNGAEIRDALLQSAAQGGLADAQYAIGERHAHSTAGPDWFAACKWYLHAAEQGHAEAQCTLADCFAIGRGVAQDRSKAFAWYEKAAAQELPRAQWNLGELYALGLPGVPSDPKQAALLCKRAAKAGFAPAQATLGSLHARAKKYTKAAEWWGLAAEQGDLEALFNLAQAYRAGQGVEKDDERAFGLMLRAAKNGLAVAQARVGLAYAQGDWAVLDVIESAKWFILAAANGDKTAAANQERSRSLLSPAQWAEAQRRAAG